MPMIRSAGWEWPGSHKPASAPDPNHDQTMTKQKLHSESKAEAYEKTIQQPERRAGWRRPQMPWRLLMLIALVCSLGANAGQASNSLSKMLHVFTREIN